ncbi:MAG: RnfABCDGE type electron transport complex subunit D [Ostreibacterium sp.]
MGSHNLLRMLNHYPKNRPFSLAADAMMRHVCYATLPAIILLTIFYGIGVLVQLILALLTATVCEWSVSKLRNRYLTPLDLSSGLVTATLLAVSIPNLAPWWLVIAGTAFGLLCSKQVFGGVGMNIFNPAVVGFCVISLFFPAEMNAYALNFISLSDTFSQIFSEGIDGLTGATGLASLKANGYFEYRNNYHWWINGAWLLGGLYLWYRKFADWRLSAVFFSIFIFGVVSFSLLNDHPISFAQQIGLGALVFTGCFIITDPVTAATGRFGRIIYATLAAILAVIIRQYSHMPDSMAFSILLANLAVPMIDNYTRPQYVKE